jgi:hypothetical protein
VRDKKPSAGRPISEPLGRGDVIWFLPTIWKKSIFEGSWRGESIVDMEQAERRRNSTSQHFRRRHMRKTTRWILPILLVIFGSGACYAQSINSGDIRGTVTDPSGALLPSVTVTVMNTDTGVSKDFTTNSDGLYDTKALEVCRAHLV